MASYVCLIQFRDQGIRNIQDTVKRGDAATAEAQKMGMKIVEEDWTMGAYDAVVVWRRPMMRPSARSYLRWVHSVMSKPKPCARFVGTRWKQFWRRSNRASQSPNFAISAGDKVVGRR